MAYERDFERIGAHLYYNPRYWLANRFSIFNSMTLGTGNSGVHPYTLLFRENPTIFIIWCQARFAPIYRNETKQHLQRSAPYLVPSPALYFRIGLFWLGNAICNWC
jgi:hypothetical protein